MFSHIGAVTRDDLTVRPRDINVIKRINMQGGAGGSLGICKKMSRIPLVSPSHGIAVKENQWIGRCADRAIREDIGED